MGIIEFGAVFTSQHFYRFVYLMSLNLRVAFRIETIESFRDSYRSPRFHCTCTCLLPGELGKYELLTCSHSQFSVRFCSNSVGAKVTVETLVLETHPLLQLGLVHLIEDQPQFHIWGVAESASAALSMLQRGLFEERLPDLMLMSASMPDISRSVNFVRQLQQSNTRVRILALLEMGESAKSHASVLVNSGVQGCCLKSKPVDHILQALTAISSNVCWMDSERNFSIAFACS